MAAFNGKLKSNEIFASLFNMIISQQVYADNIADTASSLLNKSRVDGSMYGDTKLYYASDCLKSAPWGADAEAQNLLKLYRPKAPDIQEITIDQFRQIALTVDDYLSKRAWGDESAFSAFNSVMLGWIGETKRIYDATLFNSFVGTVKSEKATQNIGITLPTSTDKEAEARLQAQTIAEAVANLLVDVKDISRDFNDYGNLRSFDPSSLIVVWNSKAYNKIKKMDLPQIFHSEGLMDKFGEEVLPARYFGDVKSAGGKGDGATIRSLVEKDYTGTDGQTVHCFPGDIIPNGAQYAGKEAYAVNDKILFKVIHKRSIPYMSAFTVATSFFNAKSLTENHYLTFGYNTLEYLKNYPMITVKSN